MIELKSFLDRILKGDIRKLQFFIMATILLIGVIFRDFSLQLSQVIFTMISAYATQTIFGHFFNKKSNLPSALITSMGLSLLLRSDTLWIHPLAAFIAISSKFIIQWNGKHLFNPAMLGVIVSIYIFKSSWISPGQWGHDLSLGLWILGFGYIISGRADRRDISLSFVFFYVFFLLFRKVYYGFTFEVFIHQLSSGSLFLFAFFMISDPRTTPNHIKGRWMHSFFVALLAYFWQYHLFRQSSLIWSLFLLSPLVPIWDKIWEDKLYVWNQ